MIKDIVYSLLIILTVACGKERGGDYATGPSQDGIVGRWRLVEIHGHDGNRAFETNMESENYTVTFEANGTVRAPDFPCTGIYSFDAGKPGSLGDNNLMVAFAECERSELVWYSIHGIADARITDYNNLTLNFETCDEGCARVYRRLR